MENEDIEAKQNLLQTEIIDKNLNKDSFITFCLSKKENGDDLNNWTLEELQQIIKEFTESQAPKQEEHQPPQEVQENNQTEKKKGEQDDLNKENLEKMEKFNAEDAKIFKEKVLNCRKLDKSELNDKLVKVVIENPKEVSGGMFGLSYVLYEVKTSPTNWNVSRRFSDFVTLRHLLAKYFPSFNIPPLPNKKMTNRRFDPDFIQKRMKFLNLFINNVVQRENFKASEILTAFLSYNDRGKFESKFKEFSSQIPSGYVEDYKNLEGKVVISHDEGNEKYFVNIGKYFRIQGQILERLNAGLKQFYKNMNAACESLIEVHKYFDVMHTLNTRVLMKQTITKTYEELGAFFDNWKKILIKQKELVKNHMKDFFKYINFEGRAYLEIVERREDLKNKYTAECSKVTAKKEKIYLTGDLTKFELGDEKGIDRDRLLKDKPYAFEHMCKNDNANLEKMRNQLGYANKMNMVELKKMIDEYCTRFIDNVKTFDVDFYSTINDTIGSWTNMETFVASIAMQIEIQKAEKGKK